MKKGVFIVLDGGDGSGKSSIAKKLKEKWGDKVLLTREPGGSKYAEKIRETILSDEAKDADAETQFLLFWAARRDILTHVIKPAIEEGKIVICDRFDSSTYAYQIYAQDAFEMEPLFWQLRETMIEKDNLEPDIYIMLDVDVKVGIERAKGRGALNHFDARSLEFHEKVREGMKEFISHKIKDGMIVDAGQDLESVFKDTEKQILNYSKRLRASTQFDF